MVWEAILLILGAYLLGSFPSAYIAGRLLKGRDIRRYGSGSISGSNVWQMVARWAILPVGLVDVGKGVAPVLVAQRLGLDLPQQGLAGLAAIMGHNWSIYLRFTGGRGIGTSLGVLFILAPRELILFVIIALVGVALHQIPLGVGGAMAVLPLASWFWGEPFPLTATLVGMVALMIIKRLASNPGIGIPGQDRRKVLLNRLLFDRDIREREPWIRRTPEGGS